MSQTIWKYALEHIDDQDFEAPDNATVLSAQMQRDTLCLWMLVDPTIPPRTYHVKIFGTGGRSSLMILTFLREHINFTTAKLSDMYLLHKEQP